MGQSPELTGRLAAFLRRGGGWYLAALALLLASSAALAAQYAEVRSQHEMARLALVQGQDALDSARGNVAVSRQMLRDAAQYPVPLHTPYLVISIAERRLWYKVDENVLMTVMVATGSGKTLVKERGTSFWRFDTPRGRLVVESKEENPLWVPPDWFYLEEARKLKLGVAHLERGHPLATADGSRISVVRHEVIRQYPGGRRQIMTPSQQHLIVVDGKVLVPPLGTNQRHFEKVLGTHRLNLGDGYALHGTNLPETVGQAVSHGCVRLLNDDIAKLYQMVPVGTPVYLY